MTGLIGAIILAIILVPFAIFVLIHSIIEFRDNNKWLKGLDKE